MKARWMAAWLMLVPGALAWAAVLPDAVPGDKRVRTVQYDPDNVVTIYGDIAVATMILFEKGERVEDMDGGDTGAWMLGVLAQQDGITVKPKASVVGGNINVRTNRRIYNFELVLAPKKQPAFMRVQFRYPAPPPVAASPAALAAAERARVDKLLAATPVVRNRRYTLQGSGELAPVMVWDDGATTYFSFAANTRVPAIYAVGSDGAEHLENVSVDSTGLVQVHGVRPRFALRIGATVTCVFNEGYNPRAAAPATNTVSPQVTRVIKGATP